MAEITTQDVWAMARDAAESGIDPDEAARKIVKSLRPAEVRSFAVDYVRLAVDQWRRHRARQVEVAAEREAQRNEALARAETTKANYRSTLDDLVSAYDPTKAANAPGETARPWLNGRERKAVRRHLGDRFDSWIAGHRAAVHATGSERLIDEFESDWHPEGMHAYFAEKRTERVMELVREVRNETRIQVTRELLETAFALGNGERVTWGAATIEQHRDRVQLLRTNILGNLETAARHEAAIEMIQRAKVACLGELPDAVPA